VKAALGRIFAALAGDLGELGEGRLTPLLGDFVHEPTGTLVEIDESQHFTSFRLRSLDLYPQDARLGFDLATYRQLCKDWGERSDGYFRTKAARTFGVGGRQRQRAYYDALRDLAPPAIDRPPTIRIEAASRNSVDAYERHRDRLLALLD